MQFYVAILAICSLIVAGLGPRHEDENAGKRPSRQANWQAGGSAQSACVLQRPVSRASDLLRPVGSHHIPPALANLARGYSVFLGLHLETSGTAETLQSRHVRLQI